MVQENYFSAGTIFEKLNWRKIILFCKSVYTSVLCVNAFLVKRIPQALQRFDDHISFSLISHFLLLFKRKQKETKQLRKMFCMQIQ